MKIEVLKILSLFCLISACTGTSYDPEFMRPNILFIITDDQSWEHLGAYGDKAVRTPAIDRLAAEGLRFENAYTAAPSCSPSRAGILTGQDVYRLKEGGVLTGFLRNEYVVFPELLEESGYIVGSTGKRYWPMTKNVEGANEEPIANVYREHVHQSPPFGISKTNYSANFKQFIEDNNGGKPFFFWVGIGEPHIKYEIDRGLEIGIDTSKIRVPKFFPDVPVTRLNMADYLSEIEWADHAVAEMMEILESKGLKDNTLVIFTSDNGMPLPRSKATLYDHGVRMPLIIRWGDRVRASRVVTDPVSLTDMAPTFLDLAGIEIPEMMTGRSIKNLLLSEKSGDLDQEREFVVSTFEKHTLCRPDSMGYPRRAIHTEDWTYIINYEPDRYPNGNIDLHIPNWDVLGDTDPTRLKEHYKENVDNPEFKLYWDLAFGKVPLEQLFSKIDDRDMIKNLAYEPEFKAIKEELKGKLEKYLLETGDPRASGESPWDEYNLDK